MSWNLYKKFFMYVALIYIGEAKPLFLAMFFLPIYIGTQKLKKPYEKDNNYISFH